MTRARNDEHSTEFGLWLREQKSLDSKLGYVASNLDYIWSNYKTGKWLLLEEKRYGAQPKRSQRELFRLIHTYCRKAYPLYRGFYILVFENTAPNDGDMWLNGVKISVGELMMVLRFESDWKVFPEWLTNNKAV